MKPVVSSIVALAIAITPAFAMAAEKSTNKPVAAKVVKHAHKTAKKAEKPAAVAQVKHVVKKDGDKKSAIQKVNHEVGHKGEPKVEHGVTVIPASLTTKQTPKAAPQAKPADLPKLPAPAANKPAHAKEKGARKPTEKKSDDKSNDGQAERDEDFAELVARIRGQKDEEPKPSSKQQEEDGNKAKHAKVLKTVKACSKDPVEITRGAEVETFELTSCDGAIAPLAVEHLSVLVRPGNADRPTKPLDELAKKQGKDLAKNIKRIDPGLVTRLQAIADHFHKKGQTTKISVVSGYRPASVGSLHQTGRAMDFRVEGVTNEDVVAFCKTLGDTGCGYYPNSSFVHVDVRDPGAGHVAWIDASGPGETPRYVSAWPPPEPKDTKDQGEEVASKPLENTSAKLIVDTPPEVDDHPSETETTTQ